MKKINILLLIMSIFAFQSCLLDDEVPTDNYASGPNFVGFDTETRSLGVPVPEDAVPVTFEIGFDIGGPTSNDINGDITVQISIDESGTAVEGVNFELPMSTVTLTSANDYSETLPITVLVDGIEPAAITETPYAILNITEVDASGNLVANGRTDQIQVNINYLCVSELAGTYAVVVTREDGAVKDFGEQEIVPVEGEEGLYLTESTGLWDLGQFSDTQGLNFSEVCNRIIVPYQDLFQGLYSNDVVGYQEGSVDENGVITMYYSISFSSGDTNYTAVYTPVN